MWGSSFGESLFSFIYEMHSVPEDREQKSTRRPPAVYAALGIRLCGPSSSCIRHWSCQCKGFDIHTLPIHSANAVYTELNRSSPTKSYSSLAGYLFYIVPIPFSLGAHSPMFTFIFTLCGYERKRLYIYFLSLYIYRKDKTCNVENYMYVHDSPKADDTKKIS